MRDLYGRNTFGQSCLLLARRLVEAGTRVVEVIWPKVANSDNHSWDHHTDLTKRMKNSVRPHVGCQGLSGIDHRLGFSGECWTKRCWWPWANSAARPQRGISTSGNSEIAQTGATTGPIVIRPCVAGAGIKRGYVHGKSDKTASSPHWKIPSIRASSWPAIYHAFGIDPETIVYNHLNQPRELVKAQAVTKLFA